MKEHIFYIFSSIARLKNGFTFVAILLSLILISGCNHIRCFLSKNWMQASNCDCIVFNPYPAPDKLNETVTWDGACVQGKINGFGTLVWYKNNQYNQKLIGNFKEGRSHGKITIFFSSGRIKHSYHQNGYESPYYYYLISKEDIVIDNEFGYKYTIRCGKKGSIHEFAILDTKTIFYTLSMPNLSLKRRNYPMLNDLDKVSQSACGYSPYYKFEFDLNGQTHISGNCLDEKIAFYKKDGRSWALSKPRKKGIAHYDLIYPMEQLNIFDKSYYELKYIQDDYLLPALCFGRYSFNELQNYQNKMVRVVNESKLAINKPLKSSEQLSKSLSRNEFVNRVKQRIEGTVPDNKKYIIKNAQNSRPFRTYWVYLAAYILEEGLKEKGLSGSILGIPTNMKVRLVEAEEKIRLQYDIPNNKIPMPDHLGEVILDRPVEDSIERYIQGQ